MLTSLAELNSIHCLASPCRSSAWCSGPAGAQLSSSLLLLACMCYSCFCSQVICRGAVDLLVPGGFLALEVGDNGAGFTAGCPAKPRCPADICLQPYTYMCLPALTVRHPCQQAIKRMCVSTLLAFSLRADSWQRSERCRGGSAAGVAGKAGDACIQGCRDRAGLLRRAQIRHSSTN